MGRKQETLLFAVDSKLPRGTRGFQNLKKSGLPMETLSFRETPQNGDDPKPYFMAALKRDPS